MLERASEQPPVPRPRTLARRGGSLATLRWLTHCVKSFTVSLMARRGVKPDEFNSLTIAQAARFLGISRQTVYTWIEDGALRAHRVGPHHRILRTHLDRVKARR